MRRCRTAEQSAGHGVEGIAPGRPAGGGRTVVPMTERDALIESLARHRGFLVFASSEVYGAEVDWEAVDAEAQDNDGDWSGSEWQDDRFAVTEDETLQALRGRIEQVAARTEEILRAADLEAEHALPEAPWFDPGVSWSVRRVALHVLAEISQHAGHADILREAIDGQRTMG